jgi:chromosomal replication initiator protein
MGKLFVFHKDNIKTKRKTWFEPIKSVELTDNALYIKFQFFYEWLGALCKLFIALPKNLEKTLSYYKIRMENTYGNKQPFTEQLLCE